MHPCTEIDGQGLGEERVKGGEGREVVMVVVMVYTGIEVMGFVAFAKKEKPNQQIVLRSTLAYVICDAHIYYNIYYAQRTKRFYSYNIYI